MAEKMNAQERNLFQVFYSEETRKALDPGFIPLDNLANPRPDWFEIWPILDYFEQHEIDDASWYCFLSPRFREKTKFTSRHVQRWITQYGDTADVIVFSQRLKRRFANVFEQAERTHAGITSLAQQCFDELGLGVDLKRLETRGRRAVFSNYFVARGWFWRRWLTVVRGLVAMAEDDNNALSKGLNDLTAYRSDSPPVPFKVFVAERVASLLLAMDPDVRVVARRPVILRKLLPRFIRKRLEKPRNPAAGQLR